MIETYAEYCKRRQMTVQQSSILSVLLVASREHAQAVNEARAFYDPAAMQRIKRAYAKVREAQLQVELHFNVQ